MKKTKRILVAFLYLLILGVTAIFVLNAYISKTTSSKIYRDLSNLPAAHTGIILGASVHSSGRLSPVLQDRVDTGLELYRKGKVERLLLSGDNRSQDYDEVSAMRNYLLDRGVPAEHIYIDPAGLNTYDSMYRSKEIFQVPSAIVVTQPFHLPRTLFIAQHLGLDYSGFPATPRQYKTELNLLNREKLANVKVMFDMLFRPRPNPNDPKVPVTGQPQ